MPKDCPVIFACNHPNSFLDSLVMTISLRRSLHYTARGDIFKPGLVSALLGFMNILPVFRKEEGKENLHKNAQTFSACIDLFKENGAVVIYSEGICENEWDLRPLRKGTARLAIEAWNNPEIGSKLKVVPVSIQYSSWLKICPKIYIEFLENIEKETITNHKLFNEKLNSILSRKCIVADKSSDLIQQNKLIGFALKNLTDGEKKAKHLQDRFMNGGNEEFKTNYRKLADYLVEENIDYYSAKGVGIFTYLFSLIIFAFAYLLNRIPYTICNLTARNSTKGNVFYDSILFALLLFLYPIYLIGLSFILSYTFNLWFIISVVTLTVLSASKYENAKRNIICFHKKNKLNTVSEILMLLFETSNG